MENLREAIARNGDPWGDEIGINLPFEAVVH